MLDVTTQSDNAFTCADVFAYTTTVRSLFSLQNARPPRRGGAALARTATPSPQRGWRGPGLRSLLGRQHPLQGVDRDLDLVERRLARRQALQPQARRQQRAHDRIRGVVAARGGSPRRRARRSAAAARPARRADQPDGRPPDTTKTTIAIDHHPEQERRAATHVDEAVALHLLGRQLGARLVGVDRLVLRGVVLEHAPQLGEAATIRTR